MFNSELRKEIAALKLRVYELEEQNKYPYQPYPYYRTIPIKTLIAKIVDFLDLEIHFVPSTDTAIRLKKVVKQKSEDF